MKIITDRVSPHQDSRDGHLVKMVVIHGDAGTTDEGTLSWLEHPDSRVSYHYLVGRDSRAWQLVSEEARAWHAGVSHWPGCTVGRGVNHTSIGVAFANDGEEPYEPGQYRVGAELVADIIRRHSIPLHLIRGHYEVSPGRKQDPWPHFDWGEFYRLLGLYAGGRAA